MESGSALAQARHRYRQARDNYVVVFVLILFVIGLITVVPPSGAGGLAITAAQALTLLLTLKNAGIQGRRLNVARAIALCPILAVIAGLIFQREVGVLYYISMILLIMGTQAAIILHALQRRSITDDTIVGALCVYLLLGLLFATFGAFYSAEIAQFFAQTGPHPAADYVYFSFITLGTVGYGDLTPARGLPRILALAEGLFGQLYLVTVISLLVGNLGAQRLKKGSTEGPGES